MMLDAQSSQLQHALQDLSLIALSLLCLPFTTLFTSLALVYNYLFPATAITRRDAAVRKSGFQPKTILVTGVGMTKGLTLARMFHSEGHNVIGADFSPYACGRVSKSLAKFYTLTKPTSQSGSAPYIEGLLDIISKETVDLWVSCSGVASAVEDGEAKEIVERKTACRAIQFDVATTQLLHEKHTFIDYTRSIGLPVPETHAIASREAAEKVLLKAAKGRKFIMKPIGMDDANRGDMTLLPRGSKAETSAHLSKLRISRQSQWIVQQFVDGPEYCTHALVINGVVKAFVACPSAELLMHYEALPATDGLSQMMFEFTRQFAAKHGKGFTGHLSFDFLLDRSAGLAGEGVLYPIECNPRAHTAVVLFTETPGLVEAYLSILQPEKKQSNGHTISTALNANKTAAPITPHRTDKYYWIGHDFITRLLRPIFLLSTLQADISLSQFGDAVAALGEHILLWRDGTFERWDPLPWWWLYHVYWPVQFAIALGRGKKWSRVNVSTTKMFEC